MGPHLLSAYLHVPKFCYGYIFVFRAALHMVISDFFHLRLGASGGDQQHSYSLKVFIVFVALGLPFPQVHLSVGEGGSTGFQFK